MPQMHPEFSPINLKKKKTILMSMQLNIETQQRMKLKLFSPGKKWSSFLGVTCMFSTKIHKKQIWIPCGGNAGSRPRDKGGGRGGGLPWIPHWEVRTWLLGCFMVIRVPMPTSSKGEYSYPLDKSLFSGSSWFPLPTGDWFIRLMVLSNVSITGARWMSQAILLWQQMQFQNT